MFEKADNEKIGAYLLKKINSQYKSARQFCKDWLIEENINPDDDVELRRKTNKISQIKKGTKSIQIDDLAIFSKLLGITCEEILSAGKSFVPDNDRMTNYKFAFSDDEAVWEAYIKRNDSLILNTDEYDKTAIDYALEFNNYNLLKYLTGKGYIWFVGDDEKNYYRTFSAGTKIQRNVYPKAGMEVIIKEKDELRRRMISLAIKNHDFDMLTTLKAREIPTLYQATFYLGCPSECLEYYDKDMLETIANADERTIDYFTEEYKINGHWDRVNTFMFPFVGELVDMLVKNKSKYAVKVLDRCIDHNESTLSLLKALVKSEEQDILRWTEMPNDMFSEKYLEQQRAISKALSVKYIEFYDVDGMLHFAKSNHKSGIVTNVVCVSADSDDGQISNKIDVLNELYDEIKNFKESVENGK